MPESLKAYQLLKDKCKTTRLVLPRAVTQKRLCIVGEALGADEESAGDYFCGKTGKGIFDKLLKETGLIRDAVHITNIIKVRPPDNKVERLGELGLSVDDFIPYLQEELSLVRPRVILALGATAMTALTGKEGITKWRGSTAACTLLPGIDVVITFHPSYIQRGQWHLYPYVRNDFIHFAELGFGLAKTTEPFEMVTNPTLTQILDYLTNIQNNSIATSIDIETINRTHITCIGFSNGPNSAICIPFRHKGVQLRWAKHEQLIILDAIRQVYQKPGLLKVGQNFLDYDAHYLLPLLGFPREPLFDTLYAHQLIHPDARHDLGFIMSNYSDMPFHKSDFKDWESNKVPHDQTLWEYNCKDCIGTHRAYVNLDKDLIETNLHNFLVGYIMPLKRVLFEMEHRGVRVDIELRDRLAKDIEDNLLPDALWAIEELTSHSLNPNSSKQVGEYLDETLHIPIPRTEKGNYTVDEDKLEELFARFPQHKRIMELIICTRKLKAKDLGTYLRAKLSTDNRMRTSYGITKTGRLSSGTNHHGVGTNLQNQPKRLRIIFLPDKGDVFIAADLAQAEALVLVFQIKAEKLKARMLKGEKIHAIVASMIDKKSIKELTPERYRDIKSVVYGCVDAETEVLSSNKGWLPVSSVTENDFIAQWWPDKSIDFVKPNKIHTYSFQGDLYHFTQGYFDQLVTPNHRMPLKQWRYGRDRRILTNGPVRDILAENFSRFWNAYKSPLSGVLVDLLPTSTLTEDEASLLVAIQADGCVREHGEVEFNLKKHRKILRLIQLLTILNIPFTPSTHNTFGYFYIKPTPQLLNITSFMSTGKTFKLNLLYTLSQSVRETFLTELSFWDGRSNGSDSWQYYTTNQQNAETVVTLCHLTNKRGIIADRDNTQGTFGGANNKRLYTVSISNYPEGDITCMVINKTQHNGLVYCLTMPSGYFLVRRNKRVSVTGNSNYGAGIRKFATIIKKTVAEAKVLREQYFTIVPEIPAYHMWIKHELETTRRLTTCYGRTRIFTGLIDDEACRSGNAQLPQSTIADTINIGILGLWLIKPPEVKLLMQVHDEIVMSMPRNVVEQFKPYIKLHLETLRELWIGDDLLVVPVDISEPHNRWYGG